MARFYLLDTTICTLLMQQNPLDALCGFKKWEQGTAAMSAITYGELLCLAKQSDNQKKARLVLYELLSLIPPLAVTKAVNEYYDYLCAYLKNQDKSIKNNMLWVAAHALALDATLITHRLKNDVEIPQLKIENWISTVNN